MHCRVVQAEHDRSVETFLVSEARRCNPAQLALLARRISDTLDPDGTLTDIEDRKRRRHLTVIQRPDGSAHLEAQLAPLCAEALLTVLDTLARPKPARPGDGDGASGVPQPDSRTAAQRRHDGLHDARRSPCCAATNCPRAAESPPPSCSPSPTRTSGAAAASPRPGTAR